MKPFLITAFLFLAFSATAQNVAINNDNSMPDASALLDIKSSSKGLLIPRLTTAERTAIATPAIGLTVFDLNTFSYWMYRGDVNGGWAEQLHQYQKAWEISGSHIHTLNSGNVGIGTSTPTEKLSINGTNPIIHLMNSGTGRGFIQANGADIKLGTYSNNTTGNLTLVTRAADRFTITESGLVGIGTTNPLTALALNGTNPTFQLRNGDIDKGFIQLSGDDMKIGVNTTNTNGRLVVRTNATDRVWFHNDGKMSVGTNLTTSSTISIGGTTPGIAFFKGTENFLNIRNSLSTTWIESVGTSPDVLILRVGNSIESAGLNMYSSGLMSIGTGPQSGYRLTILGKIMCADVQTSNIYNWPDYVFSENYSLKTLSEVKKYITEHKHLPNIPAATEVEKNGVQLGDMSRRLLEKVEELTLYILQQQEQIDELKKQVGLSSSPKKY